jgi:hypothetical protein
MRNAGLEVDQYGPPAAECEVLAIAAPSYWESRDFDFLSS